MSEQCSCGVWYQDSQAVALCMQNHHGDGKDKFADRLQFTHTLCPEYTAVCSICKTRLRGHLRVDGLNVEFNVVPHVCPVEEPELPVNPDWVVSESGTMACVCQRCGARSVPVLPMAIDAFVRWSRDFVEKHKFCKEVS